ncbi:hypothetical protein GQ600_19297 [Phytophthora cactorum]|nr:hypothetical protein GQ600_19297 [Phytophthora cactorum]
MKVLTSILFLIPLLHLFYLQLYYCYACFSQDDEMGNAVNLQTRQVRKIMNELHQDNLVCEEVLNDKRQAAARPRLLNLQRKFKDQMNKQNGMHEGLYEVLRRIGDFVKEGHALPNNLPSDNRAAALEATALVLLMVLEVAAEEEAAEEGGNRGDDQNSQSYLYPYGAQDQEIIVDIAGNDQAETTPRALPEFLQGSSISGHMAAKHLQAAAADEQPIPMETSLQGVDPLTQSEMTEEQRQEAFKRAYMAELERYNEENHEGEVQVQVDKQGWDAEMNGDAMDEEELEDVEWEWCTDDEGGVNDMEVMVNGQPKRLDGVDDEDLLNMTEEEFLSCYRMCLAENGVSQ